MIAGIDFPSAFEQDNITSRRSSGVLSYGVHYDPESLLTGHEAEKGLDFSNSKRDWPSHEQYLNAVRGYLPVAKIPFIAPRVPWGGLFNIPDGVRCVPLLNVCPIPETYPETVYDSLTIDGVRYDIIHRVTAGIRVRHEGFVEWPIIQPYTGQFVWSVYQFNGEHSGDVRLIPSEVSRATEAIVRSFHSGPSDVVADDLR